MAKTDPTDTRDTTIRELEESNATLAQRVGELTADVEARDAVLVQRDHGIASLNTQIAGLAAQRDAAQHDIDGCREAIDRAAEEIRVRDEKLAQRSDELARMQRQVDDLREDCERLAARRSSGAPLSLDIAALLDLHRMCAGSAPNDRYLATARRLGDDLVAQHATSG